MKDQKKDIILVVDDDQNITNLLVRMIEKEGYRNILTADSGKKALSLIHDNDVSIVLTDVRMPSMTGIELLERIKEINDGIIVIIITAFGSIDLAVQCIKKGANDFITKPFSSDIVMLAIEKAIKERRLTREVTDLRMSISKRADFFDFIGVSPPMQDIYEKIKAVASIDAPVLITGESGTGKELAARAIHQLSLRRDMPMISVSCPNIPAQMLESELFGHVRGAFTDAYRDKKGLFEKADHGTIFLDEIGDITPDVQAKLLRVLQEEEIMPLGGESVKKLNVRVITSTNRNLFDRVSQGLFREDLFYRINVVHITMPPLRDRGIDIQRLAVYFLNEHAAKFSKPLNGFTPEAIEYLGTNQWAGNVRELKNSVLQGVVFVKGDRVDREDLLSGAEESPPMSGDRLHIGGSFKKSKNGLLEEFEVEFVKSALEKSGGNVSKAARETGISRQSFQYLMKKYGIKTPER
ncbi:MAG: sigma-54-dependent Fis family transcriptional regulator [Deltaproteobacteria bacterium]|nr:sigma-54-dependent Fis family transcriptional regulator [Candidatus Zymogenaceae bacterium]